MPLFGLPALAVMGGGLVARFFSLSIVKFLALKLLAWVSITVVLPLVLYKWFIGIQQKALSRIIESMSDFAGDLNPAVIELTGIGAYIADHLNLTQGVSVLLGGALIAYSMRVVMRRG